MSSDSGTLTLSLPNFDSRKPPGGRGVEFACKAAPDCAVLQGLDAAMYQEFYGLGEMPFNITPDPRFLFLSSRHSDALENLRFGIEQQKGLIVLTGEVGCGKTLVCRRLLDDLEATGAYDTVLILNPRLTENQLLKVILEELGVPTRERRRAVLMEMLNEVLFERIEEGRRIVLFIDEAQHLEFPVLEHLRLLSNIETDSEKLLQIVLIGQPELKAVLAQERLRQLRQRVQVHFDLTPLDLGESAYYIRHRLHLAGGNGYPAFTPWAIRRLHLYARGTPRVINTVCDKALLSAFARGSFVVECRDVSRAVKELKQLPSRP